MEEVPMWMVTPPLSIVQLVGIRLESMDLVEGFFVNHFGGNPSDARPKEDALLAMTRVRTNRCGTSVMLAMP